MNKIILLLISIAIPIAILTNCGNGGNSEENLALILFGQEEINKDLTEKLSKLNNIIDLEKKLEDCSNQKERDAMKFFYAYMPIGDISDYDAEHYLTGIKYALLAKSEMPWGATIPDDIFKHFVLPLRINDEYMDNSRPIFYEELKERIKGLSMYDAALEINHWCHEKAIYDPSNIRTSSPLTTIKSAFGRCEELSVFTASALRAVGIPARLVYTPRWGHTDDDHSWVEAWVDKTWHYLGPCEPESRLNLAWFSPITKRGLLMHTRVFGKYNGPEEIVSRTECHTEINVTQNYTPVEKINIKIVDRSNHALEGARVEFKIFNYAEFYSAITAITDKNGIASATFGKGDILVWASKGDIFGYKKVSVGQNQENITIQLNKDIGEVFSDELDMTPPIEIAEKDVPTTEEIAKNTQRLIKEDSIRTIHTSTFAKYKDASALNKKVPIETWKLNRYLVDSRGNWKEINNYLQGTKKSPYTGTRLLDLISKEDLRNTPSEVLLDHFNNFDSKVTELNLRYVLNPRVSNEILSSWRGEFQKLAKKRVFSDRSLTPESIVSFTKQIKVLDNYNPLQIPISPLGVYKLMAADKLSRDIFFVALCRSAGIPAKIEKTQNKAQYYQNQKWHDANLDTDQPPIPNPQGYLRIKYSGQRFINNPTYGMHFTISKIEQESIKTIDFSTKGGYQQTMSWRSIYRKNIPLDIGYYALTTGTRMVNGKVLSTISFFEIQEKETSHVELIMRKDPTELQVIGSINPKLTFSKILPENKRVKTSILTATGKGFFVICFMKANHEPSNKATRSLYSKSPRRPIIILYQNEEEYKKYTQTSFPEPPEGITLGIDTKQNIYNAMGREMRLRSIEYPLFIIADTEGRIVYQSDGYNVGIAEQLEKLGNQ